MNEVRTYQNKIYFLLEFFLMKFCRKSTEFIKKIAQNGIQTYLLCKRQKC